MASAFSHPAAVVALSPWFRGAGIGRRAVLFGVCCTILPDVDAVGFWLGVPYTSLWGHRGMTHSFFFASVIAAAVTLTCFRSAPRRTPVFLLLFLCGASHGLLDAMTDGGRGIALLAPFDDRRLFLPWRPIRVSPIGVHGFFGPRGVAILESEILWIWIPCLAAAAFGWWLRSSKSAAKERSA